MEGDRGCFVFLRPSFRAVVVTLNDLLKRIKKNKEVDSEWCSALLGDNLSS